MQPCLDFNVLAKGTWDYTSWNCCPQGYVVHSDPITSLEEGQTLVGYIEQIQPSSYVYNIVSSVVGGESVSLVADMTKITNWSPNWIETQIESYYVTNCSQFPAGVVTFSDVVFQLQGVNTTNIPWSQTTECALTTCPNPAICSGQVSSSPGEVQIGYQT